MTRLPKATVDLVFYIQAFAASLYKHDLTDVIGNRLGNQEEEEEEGTKGG